MATIEVPAASLSGSSRLRPHGVVEIARVAAVDGDERRSRRSARLPSVTGLGGLGEADRFDREFGRNVVAVDGDQAESARIAAVADALDDAGLGRAEAAARLRRGEHDLAVLRVLAVGAGDAEFTPLFAVGRLDAAALARVRR